MEDTSNKVPGSVIDDVVWNHEEEGGSGCYHYKDKEHLASAMGLVCDGVIEELEQKLDQLNMCKYTFNKDGQWFIKDLVHKSEMPFSYNNFWKNDIKVGGIWYPEI